MNFVSFEENKTDKPLIMLIPGLGVSYEIFLPLINLLKNRYRIVAVQIDGFILGKHTSFTSIDDQASQIIDYVKSSHNGRVDCVYGLSLGGKILSRVLERDEIIIDHAIMDAAPLLSLPNWLVELLRYYQSANVWTCFHWRKFWSWVFHSHYFDVILDECRKIYPYGGRKAVLDGYKSVYTSTLQAIFGSNIYYWYGTKEAFVARPQSKHLLRLCPTANIEIFPGMNHGQLLVDNPEMIMMKIEKMLE